MSTKVNKKAEFHLTVDARQRLFSLSQRLLWLLDKDAKEGFRGPCEVSVGPWFHKALILIWCRPIKAVRKRFKYLGGADCPRVFVRADYYDSCISEIEGLKDEVTALRMFIVNHGLSEELRLFDSLPF